jgi:SAM-dependent methyltransferase
VDVLDFVLAELPATTARVLEVGCGNGELAKALSAAGCRVLAIDPEAPDGPLFRRSLIENLDEPAGTFEAVVASRSLHHVDDLAVALDKVASVLEVGGAVLIDDFAWERLDAAAADLVGIPFDDWREEHDHLHSSVEMLSELDARFTRRAFSWEPYLYREGHHAVTEEAEQVLIEAGQLPAIGFRYVGRR